MKRKEARTYTYFGGIIILDSLISLATFASFESTVAARAKK
jgi:hypothetical protein